jgi:hypothetical protein
MTNTFRHSGGLGDMILGLPVVMTLGGIYYLHEHQHKVLGKLFDIQPYIEKVIDVPAGAWKDLKVTHNLDLFRGASKVSVAEMHLDAFNIKFDLTQKWLFPGRSVNWEVLRGYEKHCIFIGYDRDYQLFKQDRKLDIPYYKTANLYEVAQVIAGSYLFIGNSSAPYTIAEGLKKHLVLDVYEGRPQYPFGHNSSVVLTEITFLRDSGLKAVA